ncbi:MAG: 16S rRNA (adenine(1518)-N(6)/adenine(1519)-N(6))-dimethyltransferase RsmA [Candidatus Humimicrobiia bacterium]
MIVNLSTTKKILKEFDIKPKKRLGQHFLIDGNVLRKIIDVAKISNDDNILEIGGGIGTLTEALLKKAKKVICVEYDNKLISVLKEVFKELNNLIIIQADALKYDFNPLIKRYSINKMVSNLPYNIALTLIFNMLNEYPEIKRYIVLVQAEIGERLTAKPKDKNYTAISVKMSLISEIKSYFKVSKNVFLPSPEVDSKVIEIKRKKFCYEDLDKNKLFKFIDISFRHRRKKLINSILRCKDWELSKAQTEKIIGEVTGNESVRAEELNSEDFIKLYRKINKFNFFNI